MSTDEIRDHDADGSATEGMEPNAERAEREAEFTRRALLQAGWTAPAVLAVTLPRTAYAQTTHTDTGHIDQHNDGHGDGTLDVHTDTHTDDHLDDTGHTDTHQDNHTDSHTDQGQDLTQTHDDLHADT